MRLVHARHLDQSRISCLMPVGIVIALEMIDIQENQRQAPPVPARTRPLLGKGQVEMPAIEEPGQSVGHRQTLHMTVAFSQETGVLCTQALGLLQ